MPEARFIQLHWLASYPGTLLNRDDLGQAKRLQFGGAERLRISSQAIKRRLRMADDPMSLREIPQTAVGERSKHVIERAVLNGLAAEAGKPQDIVDAVRAPFEKALYGEKGDVSDSRQALLVGHPEIRFLRQTAKDIVTAAADAADAKTRAEAFQKAARAQFKALRDQTVLPGGIEAALFGRMVTSDTEANIDAAVHVAHALSVHALETEIDYVTAVDDLANDEETGAAGIFDAELTSGLYYGYIVVDVPGLVSNTLGIDRAGWNAASVDRTLAGEVVYRLIHLLATVSPGAKKGSTAPYAYADTVLAEIGSRQPRTLANAFLKPVPLRNDPAAVANGLLFKEVSDIDGNFGTHESRRRMTKADVSGIDIPRATLAELAAFARDAVIAGSA